MHTTIVVGDDHQLVRQGIRRVLETRGDFEVVGEAGDGEAAVALVAERRPHIVLMDINMPRLSGIDATRRIGLQGLDTRVLVLSMRETRGCVEEVLRAGAAGYLVKTAPPEELFSAIEAVRGGSSYLSRSLTRQVVEAIAQPGDAAASGPAGLTEREREVLQLIAAGLSSREIAAALGISLKTVDSHRSNLMEKLDLHKVAGLVRYAIRSGLVEL